MCKYIYIYKFAIVYLYVIYSAAIIETVPPKNAKQPPASESDSHELRRGLADRFRRHLRRLVITGIFGCWLPARE